MSISCAIGNKSDTDPSTIPPKPHKNCDKISSLSSIVNSISLRKTWTSGLTYTQSSKCFPVLLILIPIPIPVALILIQIPGISKLCHVDSTSLSVGSDSDSGSTVNLEFDSDFDSDLNKPGFDSDSDSGIIYNSDMYTYMYYHISSY